MGTLRNFIVRPPRSISSFSVTARDGDVYKRQAKEEAPMEIIADHKPLVSALDQPMSDEAVSYTHLDVYKRQLHHKLY